MTRLGSRNGEISAFNILPCHELPRRGLPPPPPPSPPRSAPRAHLVPLLRGARRALPRLRRLPRRDPGPRRPCRAGSGGPARGSGSWRSSSSCRGTTGSSSGSGGRATCATSTRRPCSGSPATGTALPVPSLPDPDDDQRRSRAISISSAALRSLQLLGTAHTPPGRIRLAGWLLHPAPPAEIALRQEAVRRAGARDRLPPAARGARPAHGEARPRRRAVPPLGRGRAVAPRPAGAGLADAPPRRPDGRGRWSPPPDPLPRLSPPGSRGGQLLLMYLLRRAARRDVRPDRGARAGVPHLCGGPGDGLRRTLHGSAAAADRRDLSPSRAGPPTPG